MLISGIFKFKKNRYNPGNDNLKSDNPENDITEIYEKYFSRLYGYAFKCIDDEQGAHSVTADTFMTVKKKWSIISGIEEKAKICFLYRTLKNHISNFQRKERRLSAGEIKDIYEQVNLKCFYKKNGQKTGTGSGLFELKSDINEELQKMGIKISEVLTLRLYGNLSFAEISEILNIPEGTARRRFHEGIIRLRIALKDYID
jgi:RNA polymerase sigma-70 factor (ECF subfamily)